MNRIPHPIPYQGSKRLLAASILRFMPPRVETFYEPFAGSAAVSLAVAAGDLATNFHIGDALEPLTRIWKQILQTPDSLADDYGDLWTEQLGNEAAFYNQIRNSFNTTHDPAQLLYLLARCVKNAVRFNQDGCFNQSPDHRRKGVQPGKMRENIKGAHRLLSGRTTVTAGDYSEITSVATPHDVIYFDPPYMGVSNGRDRRYLEGLDYDRFLAELHLLNQRGVPFLLSFDGRCGGKVYGESLPAHLELTLVEIEVGRSSQATLNGRSEVTVESLYLSSGLATGNVPASVTVRGEADQLTFA